MRPLPLFFALLGTPLAAAASPAAPCVTVTHAAGQTCVPRQPLRIVTLDTGELDVVLALGLRPVGAAQTNADGFPNYLRASLGGVPGVGLVSQPSLERIAALKPDLILANGTRHARLYAQLSAIAPTVVNADTGADWKADLKFYARVLGRESRATTLLTEHLAEVKRLHQKLGAARSRTTFSVVQFHPSITRVMLRGSFIGSVLNDLNLQRPAPQRGPGVFLPISAEQLPLADATYLFYAPMGTANQAAAFKASPLWAKLGAVQAGRVREVDPDHWIYGFNILAVRRIVQDIEKAVSP